MNDLQREASRRAEAAAAPAMQLYEERNKLAYLYYRLSLDDLKRLNALVRRLSDDDLRQVAAYAEGLAAWGAPDTESPDAQIPQRQAATSATGTAG